MSFYRMHVFITLVREKKMNPGKKYASMNILVVIFNNVTIWTQFMVDLFLEGPMDPCHIGGDDGDQHLHGDPTQFHAELCDQVQ